MLECIVPPPLMPPQLTGQYQSLPPPCRPPPPPPIFASLKEIFELLLCNLLITVEYFIENKNEELYQSAHNRRRFYFHDLRSRMGLCLQLLRPGVDFQDTCSSSRPKQVGLFLSVIYVVANIRQIVVMFQRNK